MSWIEIGSMPAKGSSSSMIEGLAASARAISQRRRSPPDSAMAGASRSRSIWNSASNCSSRSCARLLVGLGDLEHGHDVLADGEAAEDRGLLRQIAEAEDGAAVHGQAGNVLAVEQDAAAVGLHQAHDRIEAGGLAGAVGAEQAEHLAAVDAERDVGQHRLLVVGFGDRDDREAVIERRAIAASAFGLSMATVSFMRAPLSRRPH